MKINRTTNENGIIRTLKIGEIVSISLISSFFVVGFSWWIKLPLSRGIDGLATLGTFLGTIAVFGGVITALISLFTLASIDERVAMAAKNENALRSKELDERWDQYAYALEKYWAALNEQNIDRAGELMEQAYQLSGMKLSVASYTMFKRYWDSTEEWAWDQIDSFDLSKRRQDGNVRNGIINPSLLVEYYTSPTPSYNDDFRAECIKWGQRALLSNDLPDRATVYLQLAQLYALQGHYQNTLDYLTKSLALNPDQQFYHIKSWVLLLWNWNDEEKILAILKKVHKERIKITNLQIEQWVNDRKDDLYRGTMAPVVALHTNNATNTQLTVYSVGSFINHDEPAWVIQHNQTRFPEENRPLWSVDDAVQFINRTFETIGRIQ